MRHLTRKRIRAAGIVQGVGFRPFVWNRAHRFNLVGWIHNDSLGVTIEVQGSEDDVGEFVESLSDDLPPLARVDSIDVEDIPLGRESDFRIDGSVVASGQSTPVSPDISVCDDCLRELLDPNDRRYRYPFINCTNCGPRFTILKDIPYDRSLTTMKSFEMCKDCQSEYENPGNRRFHAQPNACHDCGPQIWFVEGGASSSSTGIDDSNHLTIATGERAIEAFQDAIRRGDIVAVKGIGGFHLACDATDENAVAKLRQRKGRVDKPFAVMVHTVQDCACFANISEHEQVLLESKERPVVLLDKKHPHGLASSIAPDNNSVGVMLPYSPLHYLLLQNTMPLVMTSANLADEPITRDNAEAMNRLANIADRFLLHDRDINVVCDDSVVRCVDDQPLPIRRSRGYAPMPVRLSAPGPNVLALGGEIKGTICVTRKEYAYVGQHIGDMGNLETLHAMQRCIDHFLRLFRIQPVAVAADLHPAYLSTKLARELAGSLEIPCIQVQHHHAHIASLIADQNLAVDCPIMGCCFDGTGFGTDGAIWGGEFMIADGGQFHRFAHLKYTPLPGGDASIQRPYRVALAHLFAAGYDWKDNLHCVRACHDTEKTVLRQQLERNLYCVATSSMGRLFDAVASLIGVRQTVNYEAQAAMELESLAAPSIGDSSARAQAYQFQVKKAEVTEIDAGGVISDICRDTCSGVPKSTIAARFHHAIAQMVVDICVAARSELGILQVGLSGGVFQNVLLLKLTRDRLHNRGFEVFCHRQVPPNDGGLALGQAVIAHRRLRRDGL